MRLIVTFASLFASVLLLQLGTGGVAPLDALSGLELGFTQTQIGLLGSAHFVGFFIGCWWAPRLMGLVGHSRAYAAFGATGTIGVLAHMMWIDPWAWALMRVGSGIAVAGCYTIMESWLQARVTRATRGRAMSIYRVVDISGSLGAQLFIAFLEPATYMAYNLLAIVCCAALLPLSLTQLSQPPVPEAPRLRPDLAWAISPLASVAVVSCGITGAAFRMVGPLYGVEIGLRPDQIALFLAAYVAGGALIQFPVGWLADRMDRRRLMIAIALAIVLASLAMVAFAYTGWAGNFIGALLFGMASFPVYSMAAAHAHDLARDEDRVELTAALMFLYAIGAIASPWVTSVMIGVAGPQSLFVFLAILHVGLAAFGSYRARVGPDAPGTGPYVYTPRTSFLIGRLLGRGRDPH